MSFDVVAAVDDELGIGKNGNVPWHLPGDLAHFVALTKRSETGRPNAVIMGRKTWESVPERFRPLAGRRNVVMTRQAGYAAPGAVSVVSNLDAALEVAQRGSDRVFVIGGGDIYRAAIAHPACRDLYITRVSGRFECDAFFPPFEGGFERTDILDDATENGIRYTIEVWSPRAAR